MMSWLLVKYSTKNQSDFLPFSTSQANSCLKWKGQKALSFFFIMFDGTQDLMGLPTYVYITLNISFNAIALPKAKIE